MRELKTLYRHTSHYLAGSVFVLLLGFVSFPIFTRLLTVEDYGLMSLVIKLAVLFTVFSKLGLQNSVLRFYEENRSSPDPSVHRRYFSTLFFGAGLAGLLMAAFFLVGVWGTPHSLITTNVKRLLVFAGALIFIRTMQSIVSAFLQAEGRARAYNALQIATRISSILIVVAVLYMWKNGATGFLSATVLVEGVGIIIMSFFFWRRGLLDIRGFDSQFFRTTVAFGLPLICYEIASVFLDSGDRILVQHYLGAKDLGYYSAAYNISGYLQQTLMTPINLALYPVYMKLWTNHGKNETQAFLVKSLDHFVLFATWIVCVVSITARDAIAFLASQKFQEADRLLPLLVAGLMIYAVHIFFNAGLLIYKKTLTMASLVVYACIANLVLNIILLPRIGMMGAAWATLLSFALLIVLIARVSYKLLPLRFDWLASLRYATVAVATGYACRYISLGRPFIDLVVKSVLSLILYSTILWLIDRKFRELGRDVIGSLRGSAGPDIAGVPSIIKE